MKKSLAVLMATAFVDMLGSAMIFPLLPVYALRFGGQAWMVGPLLASFSVAQLASAPLWGRVSDRYGRRPTLLIGLSAAAIAYVIFGFAHSIWLLFASRLVQGAGGGTTGVVQAYVSDATEPSQRVRGLGWLSSATNLGVMIGPAIGSLASHLGAAAPGLCAAALCVCNIVFAWAFLPETNPSPGRPKRSLRTAMLEVVRHPSRPQPRLILIYGTAMLAQFSFTAVLALYLQFRFGVSVHTIGYVFVYVGFLNVVLRALLLGPLVDRFGETRLLRTGAVLLTLAVLLFPVPHSIPGLALALTLFPAGTALLFPAVTALVSHESDPQELGQTMGVQQAFGALGRIAGPFWSTPVYQALGPAWPFVIAAAILAANGTMAFRVPLRSRFREPVPAD